ncbi:MAG TPA: type II secretion system minor pseudopilin GspK [Burkholderiaceae bacterium]
MTRRSLPRRARGAAILLALLIMTLVATLAAGMVWLQWRGIEVEAADRARGQGQWLLNAALDWGDLILRSQIRNGHVQDDLTQPWATPLAETKLSSFLSADGSHAASEDSGPDAYLSGQITDAQSKYNLYNLVADTRNETVRFELLCAQINVAQSTCAAIASNFTMSWDGASNVTSAQDHAQAVLMPQTLADLAWYGVDAKTIQQLEPYVVLIPPPPGQPLQVTKINANTAAAPVLAVAASGVQAMANNLVQQRQQNPFKSTRDIENALGGLTQDVGLLTFQSDYFEIYGQLRYEQHVIRERSLVWRQNAALVTVLHRVRLPPDAQ